MFSIPSNHCKCGSAEALHRPGRKTIYIGDGRSDLCAARKADVVFAKRALARCLTAEGRAFLPFDTLADVRGALAAAWEHPAARTRPLAVAVAAAGSK